MKCVSCLKDCTSSNTLTRKVRLKLGERTAGERIRVHALVSWSVLQVVCVHLLLHNLTFVKDTSLNTTVYAHFPSNNSLYS